MAREFARLMTSIWSDSDFVSLTSVQQTTYLALISSPDLSWCGVAPWLPQRLARLSADGTERKSRAAIDSLARSRFVLVDESTAEILVRTYVRHDKVMRQPNVVKALLKALDRVHSDALRDCVVTELARVKVEEPEAKGWAVVQSQRPELFADLTERSWAKGSPKGSRNPSRKAG